MCDFAGWPGGIPSLGPGVPSGFHSRPREVGFTFGTGRMDVHITPDVGAISPRAPRGK
jgi:hypothetical protein